jgi:UDP-glucose 4-epimerase
MTTGLRDARIVILGAAGFIGFHLANRLVESGQNVVGVDNFLRGKNDELQTKLCSMKNYKFVNLDLSVESEYYGLFQQGDLVYNCAALNGTQNFYSSPLSVIANSAIPAIYAAKYAALAKVDRYTYFGSSESYAGGLALGLIPIPTPEKIPLALPDVSEVRWSYATSKTMGEVAAFAAKKEFGLHIQILRIHNIYGPRMGDKHVIPDLIEKFRGNDFSVHGVHETRSFFYVEDLIDVLLSLSIMDSVPEILNIGSMSEMRIGDLAILIAKLMNASGDIVPVEGFSGSVLRRCPDTSLLNSIVDFTETPIETGLSKTIDWYVNNL